MFHPHPFLSRTPLFSIRIDFSSRHCNFKLHQRFSHLGRFLSLEGICEKSRLCEVRQDTPRTQTTVSMAPQNQQRSRPVALEILYALAPHVLLQAFPIGACVVRDDGVIVGLNFTAEQLLGWTQAACIGKPFQEFLCLDEKFFKPLSVEDIVS